MLAYAPLLGLVSVLCNAVQLQPLSSTTSIDKVDVSTPGLRMDSNPGRVAALLAADGDVQINAADPGTKTVDVEVGGLKHKDVGRGERLNVNRETSNSRDRLYRPEYKVTQRLTSDDKWEPCTGSPNSPHDCFQGYSDGVTGANRGDDGMLEASVRGQNYKVLAVEAMFKCRATKGSRIRIKVNKLSWGKLKIFINHKLHTQLVHNDVNKNEMRAKNRKTIDLRAGAQSKVVTVRIELIPLGEAGSNKVAVAALRMEAKRVLPAFDKCMSSKTALAKGTCVQKLGGDNKKKGKELRNSKRLQYTCLQRSKPSTASCQSPSDVCEEWLCCLSDDTRTMLKAMIRASLPNENQLSSALPQVNDLESQIPSDACVDPQLADPEAWDCECVEFFNTQCPDDEGREACLKEVMCGNAGVCQTWKDSNCQASLVENALVNRARTTNNASKSAVALTDTLGDKCAAQ